MWRDTDRMKCVRYPETEINKGSVTVTERSL